MKLKNLYWPLKKKAQVRPEPKTDSKLYDTIAQLEDEKEKLEKVVLELQDVITSTETNCNTAYQQMSNKLQQEIQLKNDNIALLSINVDKDKQYLVEKNSSYEAQLNFMMKYFKTRTPEAFSTLVNEVKQPDNLNAKHIEDIVRIALYHQ